MSNDGIQSVWGKYRNNETDILFTLDKFGMPEFHFGVRDTSKFTPSELQSMIWDTQINEVKRLEEIVAEQNDFEKEITFRFTEGEIDEYEQMREMNTNPKMHISTVLLGYEREFLTSWNLTDVEDNAPLPLPKTDPNVMLKVPRAIAEYIKESITEVISGEVSSPKEQQD
tara:strand:+ start:660 stop:1169 length:510 start_codon:yes stop_codon:yes gene_type:complete